jgi:hypothetical protein
MAKKKSDGNIIPCSLSDETKEIIVHYAEQLKLSAYNVGDHGLSKEDFQDAGIFRAAVERIRGQQAATMDEKRSFVESVLNQLKKLKKIDDWVFEGSGDRHDYKVMMPGGWISIIETKGCLDGNNTNIFERPANADEFIIWSLCQNPGADPRHNAWSGIHTRLGTEIVARSQQVDGLVIWDMLCGTIGRPCPKMAQSKRKMVQLRCRATPPPCLYLFPRNIPEVRNNPNPPCHKLKDVRLLQALHEEFGGREGEVTSVRIEVRPSGNTVERKTSFLRSGEEIKTSAWTGIRRARG